LNLGCLPHGFAGLVRKGPRNDVLAYIILLFEVEQFTNLVGTFGPETTGYGIIGETGHGIIPDFDHGKVQYGDIVGDDTAADGLAFTFPGASLTIALVTLVHEETYAMIAEDALSHGKALFVVTARDAEDVAGEFLAEDGAVDFLGHAAFVQVLKTFFVVDFDDLLEARGRDGDVDLLITID